MNDIKIIFGHAIFYGEVALKALIMFLSYTLLLVFYPVTTLLRRMNANILNTTKWPASMNVDPRAYRGR